MALKLFSSSGSNVMKLGAGIGYSVKEVVTVFEQASGWNIPCHIVPRRVGDVAEVWADPSLAYHLMGWRASRDLESMCEDV